MAEIAKQQCSFFLLRYVPDAVKNEFVNFGLVLLPSQAAAEVRFTQDWSRVQGLDPQADTDMLEAVARELSEQVLGPGDAQDRILKRIGDSFSNSVQASEPKVCLTDSPVQEANDLAQMYLESTRARRPREAGARQSIFRKMRLEFERAGVWQAMRKGIPVAQYGREGDPLRIDCGYVSRSAVKMFHAVPLRSDVNAAKVLAFSYPQLAEGIAAKEGLQAELTAIVEKGEEGKEGLERNDTASRFALETLEMQGIRIAPVSQLGGIAAEAARELGGRLT
ncbi:MAG TPA: DUF3037 domain-containing protein [Candidatus Angelobacter sp.]|nr:DUF3037 domain-containing protein [Candidatus Angelobacter sp.]